MSAYQPDQAAVDWARAAVEHLLARMQQHERWMWDNKPPAEAEGWRKATSWVRRELVGGQGCVIAAFDQRRPEIERLMGQHDRAAGSTPAGGRRADGPRRHPSPDFPPGWGGLQPSRRGAAAWRLGLRGCRPAGNPRGRAVTTLISAGGALGGPNGGERRCDAKCHQATEPDCHCVCGGRYHGKGLQVAQDMIAQDVQQGRFGEDLRVAYEALCQQGTLL